MKWEYLREEEFEGAIERSGGLCILPLGCLEKHGQHLPVGCDSIVAHGIAELAAEMEEAVVFPTGMWLGDVFHFNADADPGAVRKRGGIGLNPHTAFTLLQELCDEIARNGFRKILLFNCHGGNRSLSNQLARNLMYEPRNYAFMSLFGAHLPHYSPSSLYEEVLARREEFDYLTEQDVETLKEWAAKTHIGGHGDFMETANVYGLQPQTVAPDRFDAEDGLSRRRSGYLSKMKIYASTGWHNDFPNYYDAVPPFGCNEQIGKLSNQLLAEDLVKIIKVIKEDEECVHMAKAMHTPELLFR